MIDRTSFSLSRLVRNTFCKGKDKVIVPVLGGIEIPEPSEFHALLMPSLYGVEAFYLVNKGVPASNIFAIEDNCAENARGQFDVHGEIKACRLPDRQALKGMHTTGRPKPFSEALDEAYWDLDGCPYDLIYLDFLSQPDYNTHYRDGLLKIMRARMLAPTSTLILNFGRSRCQERTAKLNKDILRLSKKALKIDNSLPTEVYVGAAVAKTRHPVFRKMWSSCYQSKAQTGIRGDIEYVTTVVKFQER